MEVFNYEGYHKTPSFCYIEFHKLENDVTVVVATEPGYHEEGSGTSITNRAEHIATKVSREKNIPMLKLIWIEHYNAVPLIDKEETWDLVSFQRQRTPVRGYFERPNGEMVFVSPKWQRLTVEQKDRIIQGDLTVFEELQTPARDPFFKGYGTAQA